MYGFFCVYVLVSMFFFHCLLQVNSLLETGRMNEYNFRKTVRYPHINAVSPMILMMMMTMTMVAQLEPVRWSNMPVAFYFSIPTTRGRGS